MTRAFIFPGQGSQSVGMGKELFETYSVAKDVFQEVDDALSQKLSEMMFSGTAEDLGMTENTQPALMAVSMAVMRVLEKEANIKLQDVVSCVAGHSLGEYSALCAAGAFSLSDTARLLKTRGQAMQKAVPVGVGGMVAILNLDTDIIKAICEEIHTDTCNCSIANNNSPGQIVISGHKEAMEKAAAMAMEKGAKRALPLPVSAPFHSALMQPAADVMREALAAVTVNAPVVDVIANVTTKPTRDPNEIRDLLVQQVTGQVRWTESVEDMCASGVDNFVEIGSGKVLTGLVKRINKEVSTANISNPADVDAFVASL